MNAGIYKLIFSKRLNALVVVGENCSAQGKSPAARQAIKRLARILAKSTCGLLLVSSVWATPAPDALPTGGQVVQGSATISQSSTQMDINQASQRAVINWQGFDVGANATVHILQPNQAAVLLNRVVTNKPSEIFGNIDANGQVILVNSNGIVFGKDGSASAASFTATTLDINDQDFMDGKARFSSNGAQGEIVNHGTIEAKNGGYVALLGAKVSNDGKIITHNGTVALGAADSIAIPMTASGKIKMQLSAASVNAAVENTQNGVIVTEGGDVYLQAAAANNAMASVKNSGQIDTSGEQAGKAILLADSGEIKVDGSITANSTNAANKGGDIIIGRDQQTGVLAKATDVSGARLESKKGFVETSGEWLATTGTRVKAANWLLDPTNITITSGTLTSPNWTGSSTQSTSIIYAEDINYNLNAGTNVTIATSASGAELGNITVDADILKTTGVDTALTLTAHNNILLNKSIKSTTGKLDINLNASAGNVGGVGELDANGGKITVNTKTNGELSGIIKAATFYKTGIGQTTLSAKVNKGTKNVMNGAVVASTQTAFDFNSNVIGAITISQGSLLLGAGGGYKDNGNGTATLTSGNYNKTAGSTNSAITLGDNNTGNNNVALLIEKGIDAGQVALASDHTITVSNTASTGTATIGGVAGTAGGGGWTIYRSKIILQRDVIFNDGTSDRIAIDGQITGTGNLLFNGYRTTISSTAGINNFKGNATVAAGTILQANSANIFTNETNLELNGTLSMLDGSDQRMNALTGSGKVSVINGINSPSGKSRTLSIGNGKDDGSVTFSGTFTASVINLVKNGAGTQIFTGNDPAKNSGSITVNEGTLQIGDGGSTGTLWAGNVTLANNANLKYLRSANTSIANAISGTGNVYAKISAGDLTVNKDINLVGNIYLQASGAISNVAGATLSGTNISLDNSKGSIEAGTGAITKGIGTGSSTANGVDIRANITASGNLNLNGSSSSAAGLGIYLNAISSLSAGGNINATGTSANSIGAQFQGTVTAAGDINLEGYSSGNASQGLIVQNAVQSNNGNITVTGQTKSTDVSKLAVAITVNDLNYGSLQAKAININANTLLINNSPSPGSFVNAGSTGTVNIKTLTAGNEILIGGADVASGTLSSQKLGIDSNELNLITAANLVIGDTSSTGKITVSNAITTNATTGNLTLQTAGNIVVDKALMMATGKNLTLNGAGANSAISQNAAITATGLELLGDYASYNLTNIGNQVTTLAANTKSINYLNSSALILGVVNTIGITATGDVSIATQTGDLTIAENVEISATSATALILNAGKSASVGAAVGTDTSGNIKVNAGKTVSVGTNGIAQLMTGSITADTTAAALASAGHFRYNSDETSTNYNKALGSGVNVIYREKPTLNVNVNNVTKTYDGMAYTGGNGFSESMPSGLKNNDSLANSTATAQFGGDAQNAKDADTYILSASESVAGKSALGYAVNYNHGSLLIDKKEVVLSASRDYNGSKSLNNVVIDTGVTVNGVKETLTYANALAKYKDVNDANSDNQGNANYVDSIRLQDAADSSGGLAANYKFTNANSANNSVTINAKEVALSATKIYDGNTNLTGNQLSIETGIGTETLTYSNASINSKDVKDNASNYLKAVTLENGTGKASNYSFSAARSDNNLVNIDQAALTLTANSDNSKIYNGTEQTVSGFTITSGSLQGSDTIAVLDSISAVGKGTDADSYKTTVDDSHYSNGNYAISKFDGTLKIAQKQVKLTGAKTYDGNTNLTGNQLSIETGIGTETLTYSNASINSKDVKDNASNYIKAVTLQNGTGKASNYKFIAATGVNNQVTLDKANATVIANSATVNYNGQYQTVSGFTVTGLVAGETEQVLTGVSAKRTEKEVGSYTTIATGSDSNYNLNFVRGQFLINSVNPVVNPAQTINPAQSNSSNEAASTAGGSSSTSGGGKVAIAATPAPMPKQIDNASKQCSIEHPEACDDCQDALMPGVVFCLVSATPTLLGHNSIQNSF